MTKHSPSKKVNMRLVHRYLGFFMVGLITVYSVSGLLLIFRDTTFLKKSRAVEVVLVPHLNSEELLSEVAKNKKLNLRKFKVSKEKEGILYFPKNRYNSAGQYVQATGELTYISLEYPYFLNQLVSLHKASVKDAYSPLNILFGSTLLFFCLSAFWMFKPKSRIFRRGMAYFCVGLGLALLLVFWG